MEERHAQSHPVAPGHPGRRPLIHSARGVRSDRDRHHQDAGRLLVRPAVPVGMDDVPLDS
ncbi:hypothetical protein SCOCK_20249 [Actinacidiphila cocklensis]|uniref:Uncharacterized protein n=1 Tax=Actinacidiphila cocklensis TaxID=887465 RepID=A0A9W4DN91_9ACTN|nr:hypothetical protein SCOCK_20249 [Actinacidiphila cocklensis]